MASDTPLDLSAIDPPIWRVLVNGAAYGPYTLGQMRGFIEEKRITPQSKVAEGDGGQFMAASQFATLAADFVQAPKIDTTGQPANFVIICRHSEEAARAVGNALNEFGKFGEAMPGVYLLRSRARISAIRDRLQGLTSPQDQVLVVNASGDRLAWFNLGANADQHMRSIWDAEIS